VTSGLDPTPIAERPAWRGWIHAVTFLLAIPGGLLLILAADSPVARAAASVYTGGLLCGFGASAAYHRLARTARQQRILQRLDHSMIYVLIASTYTPVCLLGLPLAWGVPILCVVWAGAIVGVLLKLLAFSRFVVIEYALYPLLGWAVIVALPVLVSHLTATQLVLLLAGGIVYTAGMPILVRERPDPWPRTFGYHEVWHTFTVIAGVCHFATVRLLVA
jgi:hemolysin III